MAYILVGVAGALGAILRYAIGVALFVDSVFPYATLSINLIGSYVLAWLTTRLFTKVYWSSHIKTAIGTGFVGSFTTFSTLSVETVNLFENGDILLGGIYVFVSIIGGLVMSRLGFDVGSVEVRK